MNLFHTPVNYWQRVLKLTWHRTVYAHVSCISIELLWCIFSSEYCRHEPLTFQWKTSSVMLCREQWSLILIKTWKKNQSNFSSSKSWFQVQNFYITYARASYPSESKAWKQNNCCPIWFWLGYHVTFLKKMPPWELNGVSCIPSGELVVISTILRTLSKESRLTANITRQVMCIWICFSINSPWM